MFPRKERTVFDKSLQKNINEPVRLNAVVDNKKVIKGREASSKQQKSISNFDVRYLFMEQNLTK